MKSQQDYWDLVDLFKNLRSQRIQVLEERNELAESLKSTLLEVRYLKVILQGICDGGDEFDADEWVHRLEDMIQADEALLAKIYGDEHEAIRETQE